MHNKLEKLRHEHCKREQISLPSKRQRWRRKQKQIVRPRLLKMRLAKRSALLPISKTWIVP
jgi:hypothetical protein